ncbi:hypothetical protein GCM10023172_11360 [Hymenobacter ginsengisoli]|uniref:Uncharacterized protein n=1 Tax=Hymenobacter ginsengisoli TaxID=1051626 RepID=A0ABP8Q6J9_9BACT|nr:MULTISPECIES: hypothetical protein [unclassified Hymenobacter]MBO2031723.1 hypothetical protein [Hymenobacter sp. BT559]
MKTPFRLDEHPRRRPQPLSSPPAGYFEQLPTRVMAQVAPPAARTSQPLAWLLRAPAYLRTGIASTLLLGTFAASLWLGGASLHSPVAKAASLDAVPPAQLVEYLTSGETHVDMLELAELPTHHLGITKQYLQPSSTELTEALDAQPAEEAGLL